MYKSIFGYTAKSMMYWGDNTTAPQELHDVVWDSTTDDDAGVQTEVKSQKSVASGASRSTDKKRKRTSCQLVSPCRHTPQLVTVS